MTAHLEDVESDFSVFHRIDDMLSLPAGRFASLAKRLPAYDGALAAVARREMSDQPAPAAAPAPSGDTSPAELRTLRMRARQKEFAQYWDGEVEELDGESPEGQKALRGVVGG